MILWITSGPHVDLGFLPGFLDEDDPRPAKEQFNERYVSGWLPISGHTFDAETMELRYPGDPPLLPIAFGMFRGEIIMVFPYSIILILQGDMSFEVSRMD